MSDVLWTESFQLGRRSLSGLGRQSRREIDRLFPGISDRADPARYKSVRRCLAADEVALLTG